MNGGGMVIESKPFFIPASRGADILSVKFTKVGQANYPGEIRILPVGECRDLGTIPPRTYLK